MEPALVPGKLIIARKYFRKLQPGDAVVFNHQGLEKIKRIAKIQSDKVWVLGDNPNASTDSRLFGWINRSDIQAKIWI